MALKLSNEGHRIKMEWKNGRMEDSVQIFQLAIDNLLLFGTNEEHYNINTILLYCLVLPQRYQASAMNLKRTNYPSLDNKDKRKAGNDN